jgi:hypothetical protein
MATYYLNSYAASYSLTGGGAVLEIGPAGSVGAFGIQASAPATVINDGAVSAEAGHASPAFAIALYAGGAVQNGSEADTGASILGFRGIDIAGGAGTVTNFGSIAGNGAVAGFFGGPGVVLAEGGEVVNGSADDRVASIEGGVVGIAVYGAAGEIVNYATIDGVPGGTLGQYGPPTDGASGIDLTEGGQVVNNQAALIEGDYGVTIAGAVGDVVNFGMIAGGDASGGFGVALAAGGTIVNAFGATITGYRGVLVSAGGILVNDGTIEATGSAAAAVTFGAPGGLLKVNLGADFGGAVDGGGGTLKFAGAGGAGTVSGLGSGTLSGGIAGTFADFSAYVIGITGDWTIGGANTLAGGVPLIDHGTLDNTGLLYAAVTLDGGLIENATYSVIGSAAADTGIVVEGAGSIIDSGLIEGATYSVKFADPGGMLKLNAGAYFYGMVDGGGGKLKFAGADGPGTLSGLGGGTLSGDVAGTFTNFATYVIGATGDWSLNGGGTIGAGQSLVVNGSLAIYGGAFEDATALGGIGTLALADGAAVQLDGSVASGATLDFADGTGVLILSDVYAAGQSFAGVIAGFAGGGEIDLPRFAYSGATTLNWDQTSSTEGVLTVTDPNGGAKVDLTLVGNFTGGQFYQTLDLAGGTAFYWNPSGPLAVEPSSAFDAGASLDGHDHIA